MNKKTYLFDLIKSLTGSEKRYFKLQASLQGEHKNYILLFDIIEQQEIYDEKEVRRTITDKKLLQHFFRVKNYLYKMILKSLRMYSTEKSVYNKLMHTLLDTRILLEKGLYEECRNELKKAKNIANTYEYFIPLLEILRQERELYGYIDDIRNIDEYIREQELVIKKINNSSLFNVISTQMYKLNIETNFARTAAERSKYDRIIENPMMDNENNAISFRAKRNFFNIFNRYYSRRGDFENAFIYSKKMVDLLSAFPVLIKEEPNDVLIALAIHMEACIHLKKKEEFENVLHKFKSLRTNKVHQKQLQSKVFEIAAMAEVDWYIQTGEFEKGLAASTGIIKNLNQIASTLNQMFIYFNTAYSYFGIGNYKESLKWTNRILNDKELLKADIFNITIVLELLIHFELGNDALLISRAKSVTLVSVEKNSYKCLTKVVDFFRKKYFKLKTRKEVVSGFVQLKKELLETTRDPFEKQVLYLFDFISWVESKIQKIPFEKIVKEKAIG